MDFGRRKAANMAHALDAAMTLSLHFEAYWRRASNAHCSAARSYCIAKPQTL
jgi:hypothetical protein